VPRRDEEPGNLVITCRAGRSVYIDRGITVTVAAVHGLMVDLSIEAPGHSAVSRDDYPFAVHLQFQKARDRGDRITPDEAYRRAELASREGGGRG
jgi:sRNA-binding carbon storage regulator CsrA